METKKLMISLLADDGEIKKIEAIQNEMGLKTKSQVLRTSLKELYKKICK